MQNMTILSWVDKRVFFFNWPCLHMESKQWQLGKAEDFCQPMFQSAVAEPFTSLQQFYELL